MKSEEIKEWRKANGLSVSELAKRVGVKEGAVYAWESNRSVPAGSSLKALQNLMKSGVDLNLKLTGKELTEAKAKAKALGFASVEAWALDHIKRFLTLAVLAYLCHAAYAWAGRSFDTSSGAIFASACDGAVLLATNFATTCDFFTTKALPVLDKLMNNFS